MLLAMLQFVAPLVHAHTGVHHFSQGLHIPGLESYLSLQHASDNQFVNINTSNWDNEGILVVVDAGIKNPGYVITEAENGSIASLPTNPLISLSVFASDCNFSPHLQVSAFVKIASPQSPRAPPAIISYA